MGIFTRFRDIVNSNLNSILDRAEDPEKMVRMMILEMEDTLIEIRGACAGVIADQKKAERQMADAESLRKDWDDKAALAVRKGRDDLARAALVERRRHERRAESLTGEAARLKEAVASFQSDIAQLETKLADAREKQRSIIARRSAVQAKHDTQSRIRKVDTSDAFARFEAYEGHIDRMEAEAGMLNGLRPKRASLHEEFATLEGNDEIEEELNRLKQRSGNVTSEKA
jgi:phage shock protein A